MESRIKVVSLGPGDPEMITLKGLRALQSADIILCPLTRKGEVEISRAADMVQKLGIEQGKIELYYLPMSTDRTKTLQIYEAVAKHSIELHDLGKEVVITAEGDGGFFSSSQYIHEMITQRGYCVQRVAGVPAFIDCSALAGIHIASGETGLEVIPSVKSSQMLIERVERNSVSRTNIVLMKLSQSQSSIKEAIEEIGGRVTLHYIENCGGEDEFYTQDIEVIRQRKFPYFSIMIIEV